ncbi:hypothetical protein [Streptomyces hydrogenans]|uniref:hypothetical protein n=1 Tax=Streptomyces hydrogenans TaxID=1873719 RepID=UPI0034353F8C
MDAFILTHGPGRISGILDEMESAVKAVEPGSEEAKAAAAELLEIENRIGCMSADLRGNE